MRKTISTILLSLPITFLQLCTTSFTGKELKPAQNSLTGKKPVVLELFTSQGCSSCPSADRLLGKYANDPSIIALSFHVDYWNHLGWKDPFSSTENSERQKKYAASLGSEGIYTPQLIINGEREMVGSDEHKIKTVITEFSNDNSAIDIDVKNIQFSNGKISVSYSLNHLPANTTVRALLVQKKAVTSIRAGENEGVTLTNYNVVRSNTILQSKNGENESVINALPIISGGEFFFVIMIQDANNKIIGAIKKEVVGTAG